MLWPRLAETATSNPGRCRPAASLRSPSIKAVAVRADVVHGGLCRLGVSAPVGAATIGLGVAGSARILGF